MEVSCSARGAIMQGVNPCPHFYICSHPLTGIGGWPLKPVIRVRVPLGVPNGAVDELVELPAFQAGVCGFNPRRHHHEEREIFVPRKSLTENAGSKQRLVRKIPSSENGLGVHCTTKCGQEFQISQNNEKKKHTLWKIVPGGFEKIATGDSPYDLYDKIPWDK